jgi:hypothetical protein
VGLTFRRIADTDLPFLARVYASTRVEELARPWTDQQKAAFLDMQFRAQHAHYQQNHPGRRLAGDDANGEDVGRLYVERWPSQHCIIDIALRPSIAARGSATRRCAT